MDRYEITAPVIFEWLTSSGEWRQGRGVTRDISTSGLFLLSYPVPVPGSPIKITVELPSMGLHKKPVVLRGEGTVMGVEPEAGQPIGCSVSVALDDGEGIAGGPIGAA